MLCRSRFHASIRIRFFGCTPIAYQNIGGEKTAVKAVYVLYEGDSYGFRVGHYDKKKPLIMYKPPFARYVAYSSLSVIAQRLALDVVHEDLAITGYANAVTFLELCEL